MGSISKEMLLSIFWNGNPVHDGAAVIKGDRVTHVGAILPLSQREDLPGYYGTRHRAAVGLAEKSDALVIVVSEERGEVVAAKNSAIIPIEDNLDLKQVLREHLGAPIGDQIGAKRERRELGMAAAICVLCMASVWFSFAKGMETLTSLEVPLEFMNRDARMQILSTSVNTVRLYLSGSGTLLSSMKPDQIRVKLDLSKAVNGDNQFSLTKDNIVLPPGLRLSRIEPSEVRVAMDIPVTKSLPIQVDWVGALPSGLVLERVSLSPQRTVVVGAGRVLEHMTTLYTEKVQLGNLTVSGKMTVGLALENGSIKVAEGSEDKVEVWYTIRKRSG